MNMSDLQIKLVPLVIAVAVLTSFLLVGLLHKVRESSEYGLGGRSAGRIGGGAAIASTWMSAASFLGMAGFFYLYGYLALACVIGWTGGYVLLLILLAGQVRRFGKYTAPDFVGERYDSPTARVISALISITISVIYCAAQFKGIGILFGWLFGLPYDIAVTAGAVAVISYVVFAGSLGVMKNQQMQYTILIISFILPLMFLAKKLGYFWVLPQFGYGAALSQVSQEFRTSFTLPFATSSLFQWSALCFTLMVGTAGLPHVLSRFYIVPNIRDARWSVVWGLFFIALIYWSAPAYAVFVRLIEARNGTAPDPATARSMADMVIITAATQGGLPVWLVGILAAGGLSAAFATVSGLLMTGAASFSHDIYAGVVHPNASEYRKMRVAKGFTLVLALAVYLIAVNPPGLIVEITAVAFALAGNTIFPAFLLGIWWGRANRQGIIAGMLLGVLITFSAPLFGRFVPLVAEIFPLTSSALCGVPLVLLATILVSLLTPPPPERIRRFLATEVHGHLE
jgi:cation/acetate symporter